MNRSPRRLLASGVATCLVAGAAVSAVAVSAVSPDAAGAAGAATGSCTAWATLPARVALTGHTTLRPALAGTSSCRAGSTDGGATAQLRVRGQRPYEQRWTRFGTREEIDLYASLDPTGTYSISGGHVEVYDADEVRMASTWRTTSTVVKYGSRFSGVSAARTRVTATLVRYTADGWAAGTGQRVALQQRTASGWRTVARADTGRRGGVSFTHPARGQYRLASYGTATVWGATATAGSRA